MKKVLTKDEFNMLLEQIKQEKEQALKVIYEVYGKFIYASAYLICQSHMLADEVVYDVLLKIWQFAKKTRPQIDNPEGWIYKITVNLAKNKKKRKKEVLGLDENIAEAKDEMEQVLDEISFFAYMEGLSEEEQIILTSRFVQGLKLDEIARMLKRPLSTISAKYYRALQKIRKKLKK